MLRLKIFFTNHFFTKNDKPKEIKRIPITLDQATLALKDRFLGNSDYSYEVLSNVFERIKKGEVIDFNEITKIKPPKYINKPMTYLDMAIIFYPRRVLQYLIENGAKMQKEIIHDIIHHQPLYTRTKDDIGDMLRFLIKQGADLRALDEYGHSALFNANYHISCEEVRQNYVKVLLGLGAQFTPAEQTSGAVIMTSQIDHINYNRRKYGIKQPL